MLYKKIRNRLHKQKHMGSLRQLGRNDKYPKEILTWRSSEKDIPTWLTDECKVNGIDESGQPIIELRKHSTGTGYSIIRSDRNESLVDVKSESDYVCFGDNRYFTLTEKQLNLLYG